MIAGLLASSAASGQDPPYPYSGDRIFPACEQDLADYANNRNATGNTFFQGLCVGMVATTFLYAESRPDLFKVCVPKEAEVSQAIRVVVQYVDRHPEQLHEDSRRIVLIAMQQAWPCR